MFLPNPGIMAAGSVEKTYEDFVAHITALAADGLMEWRSTEIGVPGSYYADAQATAGSSIMTGSSWMAAFRAGVTVGAARVVQHGLPSLTVYNQQVGRRIFLHFESAGTSSYSSLNRNGYISLSGSSSTTARHLTELLYWHEGRAWKMQPSLGLGPTPYDW